MNREKIMQQWDSWRRYIAAGGKGSWPRDAFESLLDEYDEEIALRNKLIENRKLTEQTKWRRLL